MTEDDFTKDLGKLTPRMVTNADTTEEEQQAAEQKLRLEVLAEMEKDWVDL